MKGMDASPTSNPLAGQQVYVVSKILFVDRAPMFQSECLRAKDWAAKLDIKSNVKAIIASSEDEAVAVFREELGRSAALRRFPLENFKFEVNRLQVNVEDGHLRFWESGGSRTTVWPLTVS